MYKYVAKVQNYDVSKGTDRAEGCTKGRGFDSNSGTGLEGSKSILPGHKYRARSRIPRSRGRQPSRGPNIRFCEIFQNY